MIMATSGLEPPRGCSSNKPVQKKIAELSFDISHISDMSKDSKGNVWIASRDAIYQMAYENKPILLKHYPQRINAVIRRPDSEYLCQCS